MYPRVDWRLVAIDVIYCDAVNHRNLSYAAAPATTVMDFNIAAAIWFAARGLGVIIQHDQLGTFPNMEEKISSVMYESKARTVLTGMVRTSV